MKKSIKLFFSYFVFLASMVFAGQQAFAQEVSKPLNINTATLEELQEMNGVGQVRAQAIIEYREQHGPFAKIDDLLAVDGIGESTLARNRDILVVN